MTSIEINKRLSPDERRKAILKVAAEFFFKEGFKAANLNKIIKQAGGSKRSIYTEFGNKEGLFRTLVTEYSEQIMSTLDLSKSRNQSLRETLMSFSSSLVSALMKPEMLGISWLVLTDGKHYPELAQIYFDAGPGKAAVRLAEVFRSAKKRGEIEVADVEIAANQFIGGLRDNTYLKILLGLRPPLSKREQKVAVTAAVDRFLNGARKR